MELCKSDTFHSHTSRVAFYLYLVQVWALKFKAKDLTFITGTLIVTPAPWLRTTQVQSSSLSPGPASAGLRWAGGVIWRTCDLCYPCSWRTNCSAAVWPICADAALGLVLGKRSVVKYDSMYLSSNLCVFDKMFIFQCMLRMLGKKKADFIVCKLIVEIVTQLKLNLVILSFSWILLLHVFSIWMSLFLSCFLNSILVCLFLRNLK